MISFKNRFGHREIPSCVICEVEAGTLSCHHVGPLCFDCWGSGIHQTMVRKSSCLNDFIKHVLRNFWRGYVPVNPFTEGEIALTESEYRRVCRRNKETIVTDGVAS